ncbi:TetR/AcrR family transcriptional regulator [Chryseolinea soli]|uniref:TetR/AcrR family transcriptional regulator n=1 Tax=Chryseolinea soli TaxID=2321403 RepID=A0A385SY64_9BACT|nr:TetR/AcrR family transcriptional regulator [Chryseolinea soli]AYB35047.1 TetR/AcrR family transcriptional regulator [Chryseolinea soli]
MRNPEATREKILKKSGVLFNTKGYKATSISEITEATGFTKGAIYRHFKSKEDLEMESLFQMSLLMMEALRGRIKTETTAPGKLKAIFHFFESYLSKPVVKGGCPLMNAAIEADDAHPRLRKTALKILDILHNSVVAILDNGIRYKQLKPDIDKAYYASVIVASLEGAIMMSKLRGNNDDTKRVIQHLENQLKDLVL